MEAKVIRIDHQIPEVVITENDYKNFRKYLKEGYFVFKRKDAHVTLRKDSKILVTIEYEGNQKVVNLRKILFRNYPKMEEKKLIEIFENDLKKGRVAIEVDSNGYCSIIKK